MWLAIKAGVGSKEDNDSDFWPRVVSQTLVRIFPPPPPSVTALTAMKFVLVFGWVTDGVLWRRSDLGAKALDNDKSALVLVEAAIDVGVAATAVNLADFVAVERGFGVGGKGENTVLSGGPFR